jgi:hypothetical protein
LAVRKQEEDWDEVGMEDLYSIHPGISRAGVAASEASRVAGGRGSSPPPPDLTELVKAQIAGHPRYPTLLSAYIECRKVRLFRFRARFQSLFMQLDSQRWPRIAERLRL